jgi:hypothetical protein
MLHTKTHPSGQSYRVLAKYAPDQLQLKPVGPTEGIKTEKWSKQKLWLRIAEMELLAGHLNPVLKGGNFLEKDGPFTKRVSQ